VRITEEYGNLVLRNETGLLLYSILINDMPDTGLLIEDILRLTIDNKPTT